MKLFASRFATPAEKGPPPGANMHRMVVNDCAVNFYLSSFNEECKCSYQGIVETLLLATSDIHG